MLVLLVLKLFDDAKYHQVIEQSASPNPILESVKESWDNIGGEFSIPKLDFNKSFKK